MEVSQLYTADAHEAGAEMQVNGADGKELDCFLTIVGVDSKTWRGISHKKQKAAIVAAISGDAKPDVGAAITLSEATIGWRGFTESGEEIEFTQERAAELYLNAPYISDQVDSFLTNRANFTKG